MIKRKKLESINVILKSIRLGLSPEKCFCAFVEDDLYCANKPQALSRDQLEAPVVFETSAGTKSTWEEEVDALQRALDRVELGCHQEQEVEEVQPSPIIEVGVGLPLERTDFTESKTSYILIVPFDASTFRHPTIRSHKVYHSLVHATMPLIGHVFIHNVCASDYDKLLRSLTCYLLARVVRDH